VNRILGITLLVLGLFGLTCMPHEIGYLWGGIAGVSLGSMMIAFSFSNQRATPDLRMEPRFTEPRLGELASGESAPGEPLLGDAPSPVAEPAAMPQAKAPTPPTIPMMPAPHPAQLRFKPQPPTARVHIPPVHIPPVHIPRVQVQAPPPKPPAAPAVQRPDAPIPLRTAPQVPTVHPTEHPTATNASGKIATYGWFGAGRNIQMAANLPELMAAIRSGALKPQTSVHRIDGGGKTGPVSAANSDPLLRALFWAAENEVPDKVLPGLVKSLIQDDGQASAPERNTVAG